MTVEATRTTRDYSPDDRPEVNVDDVIEYEIEREVQRLEAVEYRDGQVIAGVTTVHHVRENVAGFCRWHQDRVHNDDGRQRHGDDVSRVLVRASGPSAPALCRRIGRRSAGDECAPHPERPTQGQDEEKVTVGKDDEGDDDADDQVGHVVGCLQGAVLAEEPPDGDMNDALWRGAIVDGVELDADDAQVEKSGQVAEDTEREREHDGKDGELHSDDRPRLERIAGGQEAADGQHDG